MRPASAAPEPRRSPGNEGYLPPFVPIGLEVRDGFLPRETVEVVAIEKAKDMALGDLAFQMATFN